MDKIKLLVVSGSPRKKGGTMWMAQKACEGAMTVPDVEPELYTIAGKKIKPCISCGKCSENGACVFRDDLQVFSNKYFEADGVIWSAPVYHMAVPAQLKALLDRLGNLVISECIEQGIDMPRFSKVCGALANGAELFGGQELVLTQLIQSCLFLNNIVISGDNKGCYIGAAARTGMGPELGKDNILKDAAGLTMAENIGKRVAETAKIVKAGINTINDELPTEYKTTIELR